MVKENLKDNKDPKVVVMGEEISDKEMKNWNSDGAAWGVLWIFAGIILLLNSFGIVPWEIWRELIKYWPLLLILMGVQVIFGRNPLSNLILLGLSIFVVGLAVLFSLQTVAPSLVAQFPEELVQIAENWEALKR